MNGIISIIWFNPQTFCFCFVFYLMCQSFFFSTYTVIHSLLFLLKYSWYTILCQVQVYSRVIQLYIYIYIFFYVDHFDSPYWICYNICFCFIFWCFWPQSMWNLSSPTRDQNHTHHIGRQSLNQWTTREVHIYIYILF